MVTALTAAQITAMRSTLPYTETADILDKVETNGALGRTVTWSVIATVPCLRESIPTMKFAEDVVAMHFVEDIRWEITLPYGTVVNAKQRLHIVDSSAVTHIYEIEQVQTDSWQIETVALCTEVV